MKFWPFSKRDKGTWDGRLQHCAEKIQDHDDRMGELEADNLDFAGAIAELRTAINRVERKVYRDRVKTDPPDNGTNLPEGIIQESANELAFDWSKIRPGDSPPTGGL
tara:strand:- start:2346 stop:2666 length:321 start_codon:yes stop_codon:yes gene_type:complete